MTFEQIPIRMLQLGVDRTWLCEQCDYSASTIANLLAPNGDPKAKTNKALRRIWEALDREEERQKSPATIFERQQLVLRPTDEEFQLWCRAAAGDPVNLWAAGALNTAAKRFMVAKSDRIAPLVSLPTADAANVIELPFYGTAAAGQPGGPLDVLDGTVPVSSALVGKRDRSALYVLRVNGQSMEPDYPDGSQIVCRKLKDGEFAKKGQDVIACDSSGAYFKRLEYRKIGQKGDSPRKAVPHLVSLNHEFPEVTPASDCPIVAVVVGKV